MHVGQVQVADGVGKRVGEAEDGLLDLAGSGRSRLYRRVERYGCHAWLRLIARRSRSVVPPQTP